VFIFAGIRSQLDLHERERAALRDELSYHLVRLIRARRERERIEAVSIASQLGIIERPVEGFTESLLAIPANARTFSECATLEHIRG